MKKIVFLSLVGLFLVACGGGSDNNTTTLTNAGITGGYAAIGVSNTLVGWQTQSGDVSLYQTNATCTIGSNCPNASFKTIASTAELPATLTFASLSTPAYLALQYTGGSQSTNTFVSTQTLAPWSVRFVYQVIEFKNELHLLGGSDYSYKNDVWESTDGVSWTLVTDNAPWSARRSHQVVEFKNQLYLLGGSESSSDFKNDVWKSADGVSWTLVTDNAPWSVRGHHQVVEFKNELYLLGGYDSSSSNKNDVWKSADGVSWTLVTDNASWSARGLHQVVEFKNELYLLGGYANGDKNDVWKSTDGVSWTLVTDNAPWSVRRTHQVVEFENELYLLGGFDGSLGGFDGSRRKNDVWKSTDGVSWTLVTDNAPWSARRSHQVVEFENELYLLGGYDGSYKNDVWQSSDGINWRFLMPLE